MRVDTWLATATQRLTASGIASARLDCLLLLEDEVGKDRSWLLAYPEYELTDSHSTKLNTKVAQRETHFPLAYIRGRSEFYGQTFYVDEQVLEPRPESEAIISLLENLPLSSQPLIVDVGTGSGALAISAKLTLPQAKVMATDIDAACLRVASRNATSLQAEISFVETDLLASLPLPEPIEVILANLPYVPDSFEINLAAGHEPQLAIFGGIDGLDLYRRMFIQIQALPTKPRFIITESLPPQHETLLTIAKEKGYGLHTVTDFIQVFEAA